MRFRYTYNHKTREKNITTEALVFGRPGKPHDFDLSPDDKVSRSHARLSYQNGVYWIEDLGSKHGTWVNGKQITKKTRVTPSARLQVGDTVIKVIDDALQLDETIVHIAADTVLDATLTPFGTSGPGAETIDRRHLRAFYEISQALGAATDLDGLLSALKEQLQKAIPRAERGAVLLADEYGQLQPELHWPEGELSLSHTWAKRAFTRREAFIADVNEPGEGGPPASALENHTLSAIYAPLQWQGEAIGVLYVDNHQMSSAFTLAESELLSAIANQTAMFAKNRRLLADLQHEVAIRNNLVRQIPPRAVERLLKELGGPGSTGQVNAVTLLVADVRDFPISSAARPGDVLQMFDDMLLKFSAILFNHDGTLNRFSGAGYTLLAVFGGVEPDQRQHEKALRAAVEMQAALRELAEDWAKHNLPLCKIAIGLHSGEVMQGFVGGSPEQAEYTVIGEALSRAGCYCYGAGQGEIVISPAVYANVKHLIADGAPTKIKCQRPETEIELAGYIVRNLKEGG